MCMATQYTLQRQDVYNLAIQTLSHLPLRAKGEQVTVTDLLEVVMFAAASRLSINHACRDLEGAPSGGTVLGQLAAQLCAPSLKPPCARCWHAWYPATRAKRDGVSPSI